MKTNELTEKYIKDLEAIATSDFQKIALENFKSRGLPHTKMEDWLYTKLSDVLPQDFSKVEEAGILKSVKVAGKYQLVFLNGSLSLTDSFLPEELIIEENSVDQEQKDNFRENEQDIFAAVNATANEKLVTITVPKNYVADDAISIVHLSSFENSFATPRLHITLENFSQCNFVEIFTGEDDKKYNQLSVTNFLVKDGAHAKHIKVQQEGNMAFHSGSVNAEVLKDASFKSFTFNTGAQKARHNLEVKLTQTGANCSVDGLYALKGSQHCDNFSLISHDVEHTESSQLFKGVLDGSSRGVFTGKVLVQKDAQQVNSEQLNKNLLLTKKAHVDTRPQLEVYADDVKCAHGATVGQMSDEEAFYLQSRGLSKERAQKLLIHAFCADAMNKIEDEKIEKFLTEILFESFEKSAFEHIDSHEAQL